ncbi:MAG: hypothetical protein LBC70_02235 [Chitinispirillales bacterium]|jgi:hypothetical protein|nr:hypothetical protein [Chitinispirillales bacterium]
MLQLLSSQQTEKLLTGNYAFSKWSLSMLVTRLKDTYARAPTHMTLVTCTGEMNSFINKYRTTITGNDYTTFQKL